MNQGKLLLTVTYLHLVNLMKWLRSQCLPFVSRLSLLKATVSPLLFWSCIFSTSIFSWLSPTGSEVFCILTKFPLASRIPRKKVAILFNYHLKDICICLVIHQSSSLFPEPPILISHCNCKDKQSHELHPPNFHWFYL